MSWNYRVVKHTDKNEEWFSIHEAFYDGAKDAPHSISKNAMDPGGETIEELEENLKMFQQALRLEVLIYEDF